MLYFILGMLFAIIVYPLISILINMVEAISEYVITYFSGKIAKIQAEIEDLNSDMSKIPHNTSVIGFEVPSSEDDDDDIF